MSFSVAEALAVCTSKIAQRKSVQRTAYVMYMGNDQHRYDAKITAATVRDLIKSFKENKVQYKYAFITRIGDNTVLRFYNRDMGKKFFSMTRKSKKAE